MLNKRKIVFLILFVLLAAAISVYILAVPTTVFWQQQEPAYAFPLADNWMPNYFTVDFSGTLQKIGIPYGTYARVNHGVIYVSLEVNEQPIQEWTTEAEPLEDNRFIEYQLDEPLEIKKGDELVLLIGGMGFPQGENVALWNYIYFQYMKRLNPVYIPALILVLGAILFFFYRAYDSIFSWFKACAKAFRAEKRRMGITLLQLCGFILGGFFLYLILHWTGIIPSFTIYSIFYFLVLGAVIGGLIVFRKSLPSHPERMFFLLALCIGLCFAVMEPVETNLSWDDQIHYSRALTLSYGKIHKNAFSKAESALINIDIERKTAMQDPLKTNETLNQFHAEQAVSATMVNVPLVSIPSYLPSAIGIGLTRLLGFSFCGTVIAGRIANLLCYCLFVYFSIKQVKQGKLFIAVISALPGILFLAGNYSYDAFSIGGILLGISIWLKVYQSPSERMTLERACGMFFILVIGILSKAVYFPMILIPLFLPNSRFESKEKVWIYRALAAASIMVLLCSFLLPFLLNPGGFSDIRGGEGVNAKEQLQFILSQPMEYARILLNFLLTKHLSLGRVVGSFCSVAYMGDYFVLPLTVIHFFLIMALVVWLGSDALTDGEYPHPSLWQKALSLLIAFGALCIAATSLYLSYNPVGNQSVDGFQNRYLLPVAIPTLLAIRPSFLKNAIPPKRFYFTVFSLEIVFCLLSLLPFAQYYF